MKERRKVKKVESEESQGKRKKKRKEMLGSGGNVMSSFSPGHICTCLEAKKVTAEKPLCTWTARFNHNNIDTPNRSSTQSNSSP